jgi:hypothetical protein
MKIVSPPEGWVIKPGPQTGEDEYHSQFISPDRAEGSDGGVKGSYSNESDRYTPEGGDPRTASQPPLEENEQVAEHGNQNDRDYYLVYNVETEKYHTYIPDLEPGKSYTSPKKKTRSEALEQAYKVLNARLSGCALSQLRERMPESLV